MTGIDPRTHPQSSLLSATTSKYAKTLRRPNTVLIEKATLEVSTLKRLINFFYKIAFGGTSRSLSVVNPDNTGRRAMREGIDMLEARLLQKDKAAKANLLENRIKRLVFEEQRAKKLTEIANEKAEKLLKARDRHQK